MFAWIALALAVVLGVYIMSGGDALDTLEGGEIAYLIVAGALAALYLSQPSKRMARDA